MSESSDTRMAPAQASDAGSANEAETKVVFASHEWIALARTILEDLVAEHGRSGRTFSVCEVFTNAPPGLAGDEETVAAWYFRIEGRNVEVGEGTIEGADMSVSVDYEEVLPVARLVYTPEILARREREQAEGTAASERPANTPGYLVELHNRLAVATQ